MKIIPKFGKDLKINLICDWFKLGDFYCISRLVGTSTAANRRGRCPTGHSWVD